MQCDLRIQSQTSQAQAAKTQIDMNLFYSFGPNFPKNAPCEGVQVKSSRIRSRSIASKVKTRQHFKKHKLTIFHYII